MSRDYAILVGSGFEEFAPAGDPHRVSTRFGDPSAPIRPVDFGGSTVLVLPRHGDAHDLPPHVLNYRANLAALQDLGARSVIALNTVGVISGVREPGQVAVPDQVIDYTWGREHTIHDTPQPGFAHIEFTQPFAAGLRAGILEAARRAGVDCFDGGIYAATQGPRLESAAEIDRLERDGADYVGMTGMPEASLAMELGLDYACLSLIVNKAPGRGDKPIHDDVESSTLSARGDAMRIINAFFETA
jgi:5'-methylthioinosine phosphorylase